MGKEGRIGDRSGRCGSFVLSANYWGEPTQSVTQLRGLVSATAISVAVQAVLRKLPILLRRSALSYRAIQRLRDGDVTERLGEARSPQRLRPFESSGTYQVNEYVWRFVGSTCPNLTAAVGSMRFPQLSTFTRAWFTFLTLSRPQISRVSAASAKTQTLRSMPSIPLIGALFGSRQSSSNMSYPDERSPDEWRAVLSKGMCRNDRPPDQPLGVVKVHVSEYHGLTSLAEQFRILREKGTEPPGSGKFDKHQPSEGVYTCAGCNAPLYKATHKFKSGCGWPAYFDSIPGAVTRHEDRSLGMARTEIVCSNCGGHLGHVFKGEGYPTPTDERHCVNSISLNFSAEGKLSSNKD